ncbi:hypothetical protein [Kineococcus aurantiacus]|uniref:hypothetical protein n=1 Tax=Kineococcus aurantiacus TaxID=37633 RepID=UPI0031D3B020
MADRLHAPGPPHLQGAPLQALLGALDDHQHLERPADYDHARTQARFEQLIADLELAFGCRCEVDGQVQDASHHGRITVPAAATASGVPLVVVLSNFAGLVVCAVDNPGAHSDEETDLLVDAADAVRIRAVLSRLDLTLVPEDPLWRAYDGDGPLGPHLGAGRTWFERYFDYL